ncbi:MAG: hypothetical protein ACE145_06360 [Terriglobia bacterium]
MLQAILLLAFCLLTGLASLTLTVWMIFSGRLLSMDGLTLVAIIMTIGAFFMGNFAWSVHTGEVRAVWNHLRSGSKKADTQE